MGYGLLWVMGYGEAKLSINARSNLLRLGVKALQTLSKVSLSRKISNSVWPQIGGGVEQKIC